MTTANGLMVIANKPPIVATHVGGFDGNYADTLHRYDQEVVTYVRTTEIQQYQHRLFNTILTPKTTLGCLVAPFGYGKTSTTIGIWQAAHEAGLLAIPPFSCNSIAEMGQAIATGVELALTQTQPQAVTSVKAAYHAYLISSAERLAEQDADEYDIPQAVALRSIQDKLERGLLNLEASGIHLLRFLEQLVEIVINANFTGLVIIVDEFQQFLGNINKAVVTNFRTLVWGLKTRRNLPLGFLLTMDPDTERNLSERAGDILHRIKEDGLYLNFASMYDREFPRLLWDRYATTLDFQGDSGRIVDRATLEAIGQICERPDLSNGPRTVINTFQQIATAHTTRQKPYTPLDLIDDFLIGAIKFDGDRNKIASLVTELTGYDYIKRIPSRVNTLKLIAAFPRGCPREVAEQYSLADTFDQLADELRGEILTGLPEGIALIDLQRVGKPQNKLNIILKKYWLQITESEIISGHILTLFARFAIDPLFPTFNNMLQGWRREATNFLLTPAGGYWQIYEGTFAREYPLRRICVQICRHKDHAIDPFGLTDELDLNIVFVLHHTERPTQAAESAHWALSQRTLILYVPINQPFSYPLARDIRWIEDYLSPVVMTPGVLLSLIDYIDRQLPTIEGLTEAERQRINDTQTKLQNFLLTMLFDGTLFNGLETPVIARGMQALPEALFAICRMYYPNYHSLITLAQWETSLDTYKKALSSLTLLQRRGIENLVDSKANIADKFEQRNHAGFPSWAKQLGSLLVITDWSGNHGEIQFQQHPAEIYLLNSVALNGEMSEADLLAEGRRAGYTFKETKFLLAFLEQRGYLEVVPEQSVYRPINVLSYAELDELNQTVQRELDLLSIGLADDSWLNTVRMEVEHIRLRLQQDEGQFNELQVRLLHQQRRLREGRDHFAENIRTQLRNTHDQLYQLKEQLEQALPLLPANLVLATHLNGVQRVISEEHPPAAKRLSNTAAKLAEFLQRPFNLDEVTLEQLESFIVTYQQLLLEAQENLQQAQELIQRAKLYRQWVELVEEVQRVPKYLDVAAQIVDTVSLRHTLEELVSQARQDFATIGIKGLADMYELYAPQLQKLSTELNMAVYLAKTSTTVPNVNPAESTPGAALTPTNGHNGILHILESESALSITALLAKTGHSPGQLIQELIALEESRAITSLITPRHGQT